MLYEIKTTPDVAHLLTKACKNERFYFRTLTRTDRTAVVISEINGAGMTFIGKNAIPIFTAAEKTNRQQHPVAVLMFRKDIRCATIVTDGERTKSFEWERSQDHASLHQAIAYLESQGYEIDTEEWT